MKFHDFSPFYRSGEGIRSKVAGDRLIDNPAVADAIGGSGASFSFDGTDGYIEIGDQADLDMGVGDFSVSVWVKTSMTAHARVISKQTYAAGGYSLFHWNSGGSGPNIAAFIVGIPSAPYEYIVKSTAIINDGEWHHIVGVADRDGNASLYIDGILDATLDISASDGISTSNALSCRIGDDSASLNEPWDGQISQVRIHNRALSAAEVRAAYNGQAVGFEYVGSKQDALITGNDSDFATIGNWVAPGVTAISSVAGGESGNCLKVLNSSTAWGHAGLAVTTVVGKKYRVSGYQKNGTNTVAASIVAGPTLGWDTYGSVTANNADWAAFELVFTAGATTTYISYYLGDNGTGLYSHIDSVSLVQIGCVAEYLPSGINATQWVDTSGNNLHGSTSTATAVNHTTGTLTMVDDIKLQAGAGINFSNYGAEEDPDVAATDVTGNLLDDYEEGTWTPAFTVSAVDAATVRGVYTKVGRQVTVDFYMQWAASGITGHSNTGGFMIEGLPFDLASNALSGPSGVISYSAYTGVSPALLLQGNPNTDEMQVKTDSDSVLAMASAIPGNSMILTGTFSYRVSD